MDPLGPLLERLAHCTGFDDAAGVLLGAIRAAWEAEQPAPPRGRGADTPLRHLGLHWQEGGAFVAAAFAEGLRVAEVPASRTLWAALDAAPVPTCLHVRARVLRRPHSRQILPAPEQRGQTIVGLERSPLTHLLALPLLGVGGAPRGMVLLGLHAPGAREDAPPLPEPDGELAALLRLAGLCLPGFPLSGPPEGAATRSGRAAALLRALDAAPLPGPLLLLGEPGTGPHRTAADLARRRGLRLVTLPAAGLRGADLDAELAPGTLVFVPDLEDLPRAAQSALLDRLGEPGPARPGAAPGRGAGALAGPLVIGSALTPTALAAQGRLLPALERPLAAWILRLPRLAERLDDLPGLVAAAQAEGAGARSPGEGPLPLAPEALVLLRAHPWQRDLRELETAVKLAVQAARAEGAGALTAAHVGPALRRAARADGAVLDALRPGLRLLGERAAAHPGLRVELLEGLAGLYLAERLEGGASPNSLADELGLAGARAQGNHLKLLRPAADRLRQLCDWLGEAPPPALTQLEARRRGPR